MPLLSNDDLFDEVQDVVLSSRGLISGYIIPSHMLQEMAVDLERQFGV